MRGRRRWVWGVCAVVGLFAVGCVPPADPGGGGPVIPGTPDIVDIEAGMDFTCALVADGSVYCWGQNHRGGLGVGDTSEHATAQRVVGITTAISIGVGNRHACAALLDGTVSCWGMNEHQQLGSLEATHSPEPVPVEGVVGAVGVTGGELHSCALLRTGRVTCWGYNHTGALGDGTNASSSTPVVVASEWSDAIEVHAAGSTTCATRASGATECWGWNNYGQLGGVDVSPSDQWWVPIGVVGSTDAVTSALGSAHGCEVSSSGSIRCWGRADVGQLGSGVVAPTSPPVEVVGIGPALVVATGTDEFSSTPDRADPTHSCAVLVGGDVVCWGANDAGQLGDGGSADSPTPVAVLGLDGPAVDVAAGRKHTCALMADGLVRCWGAHNDNQHGTGYEIAMPSPVAVAGLPTPDGPSAPQIDELQGVAAVSVGRSHTCALMLDSTVQCWGGRGQGEIGRTEGTPYLPGPVVGLTSVADVSAGGAHSCAQLSSGAVTCWGRGSSGQLGTGSFQSSATPVPVVGVADATALDAGIESSCAVLSGGTVSCWGSNSDGQLGDGLGFTSAIPTDVVGLTNAVDVGVGERHACALRSDGTVACWGNNQRGQLGDGTTTAAPTPVDVVGLTDVTALHVGREHTCVERTDGTSRCWGSNQFGQLGDAMVVDSSVPVVPSAPWITAQRLGVGEDHSCAVVSDTQLDCWGLNASGQLGLELPAGTTWRVPITAPAAFPEIADIGGGAGHSCAVHRDTTVSCWGTRSDGRLGDGFLSDGGSRGVPPVKVLVG